MNKKLNTQNVKRTPTGKTKPMAWEVHALEGVEKEEKHRFEIVEKEQNRINDLEKQRNSAVEEYKEIKKSVQTNYNRNVGKNTGTLTMIFGAAAASGILVLGGTTLISAFASVATLGVAAYSSRKIQQRIRLKMTMHKEMVKICDKKLRTLQQADISKRKKITFPSYANFEKQARKIVGDNKQEILKNANHKTVQNTFAGYAVIALIATTINSIDGSDKNIREFINDGIRSILARDPESETVAPLAIPSVLDPRHP